MGKGWSITLIVLGAVGLTVLFCVPGFTVSAHQVYTVGFNLNLKLVVVTFLALLLIAGMIMTMLATRRRRRS
jgi:hypothetical protein